LREGGFLDFLVKRLHDRAGALGIAAAGITEIAPVAAPVGSARYEALV